MTAHSTLGASSMYRWAACPGSVREAAKPGLPSSRSGPYAEEGSDAHALAAHCLTKSHNPGAHIHKKVTLEGRSFVVTQEMADAVQVYLDEVRSWISAGDVLQIEQRFDLSAVHPGCFGTADAVAWIPDEKLLIVGDYKHGAGLPVTVENNPQLQYYGLGALLASGYPAKRVRLVIVQPRCDHPDGPVRSWEIDALDLLDFQADLKNYAVATEASDAPLVPGDHCRFCPAAALCPALVDRAQAVAKLEFSPVLSYDPAKLRMALDSREPLKAWLKALDEFAYAEAEAGRTPPGYKLVAKRANRKWRDEGEVIETLQNLENANDFFEPRTVISPAQAEKVAGKIAYRHMLAQFVIQESSGHVLAPESDKRPAVKASAQHDFDVVTDQKAIAP